MEVAYKVTIKGYVTGIGFRYSARDRALQFKTIKGYIRNASYGEVEAWVQGDKAEVELMLEWLKTGPRLAKVEEFSFLEEKHDLAMSEFEIL
ncbi:MAG TPA: acylphosphatase [Lentisphaeria bacterium]|nr:MAG: hypothetical protein A2X48_22475 [Lentisphaerae bacterium GWF2_49_21]HBC89167.1 acylphosphatase [Lentisphaeria bacterium]